MMPTCPGCRVGTMTWVLETSKAGVSNATSIAQGLDPVPDECRTNGKMRAVIAGYVTHHSQIVWVEPRERRVGAVRRCPP